MQGLANQKMVESESSEGMNDSSTRPALLEGAPFEIPHDLPASMAGYIRELVRRNPGGEYVEIDRDGQTHRQTYSALLRRAEVLLPGIRSRLVGDESREIILCLENALDFIPAAWAALFCGANCVPWPIAELHRNQERFVAGLQGLIQKLGNPLILTEPAVFNLICEQKQIHSRERVIDVCAAPDPSLPASPAHDHSRMYGVPGSFLISTSGTTGNPKLATLDNRTVLHRFFDGYSGDEETVFLYCLPHYTVTGVRLMLPRRRRVVYMHPFRLAARPLEWFKVIEDCAVTAVGLPTSIAAMLTRVMETEDLPYDLSSITQLGFGGEAIVPTATRRFIRSMQKMGMGQIAVTLTYAMTECGPVCQSTVNDAELSNLIGESVSQIPIHVCFPGWRLRIADESDNVLPEGESGRIQVYSEAKLFAGYHEEAALNARCFTDDGWFSSGDLGRIVKGGLIVEGREKATLNINARKIPCEEIEAPLRVIDGVSAHRVIAAPCRDAHSVTDEVAVFFVPELCDGQSLAALARRMVREVAFHAGVTIKHLCAVPASEIELTANLKVQRDAMVRRYREGAWRNMLTGSDDPVTVPAQEENLLQVWVDALQLPRKPSAGDNFFELGGDSLSAARLIAGVEEAVDVLIPIGTFFECPTPAGMARLVEAARNIEGTGAAGSKENPSFLLHEIERYVGSWEGDRMFADSLIVGLNTGGTRPPLFWVFQSSTEFEALAERLGQDQPLYGMRSCHQVLKMRDYANDTLQPLINRYLWELMPLVGETSYALAGNCQGGVLALFLARRLVQLGRAPALLILMEWGFSFGSYADPVLLLHGKDRNADRRDADDVPEGPDLQSDFPNHKKQPIGGAHGKFFGEPGIEDLAAVIASHLSATVL